MSPATQEGPIEMKSVDRIAAILKCFSPDTPELTLPELSRLMGLGKATVYRYATALHQAGLLKWDEERKVYGVGPEPMRLASVLVRSFSIEHAAAPYLRRLTESLDLTSTLAVWFDGGAVVVACDSGTSRIVRQDLALGTRMQRGHAAGLILQAFGPPSRQPPDTPHDLDAVRRAGIAINTNLPDGLRALSAPVIQGDMAIAALSILGPLPILPDDPDSQQARVLKDTARELSVSVGGHTSATEAA
jgi:DNA-binding IclR family transcriptional regulator